MRLATRDDAAWKRGFRLGVHYRLCEDLDGANTIASFNWPGIVVYLGGPVPGFYRPEGEAPPMVQGER